jgi:DNA-binding LacI/PurR family transcriptional regulator
MMSTRATVADIAEHLGLARSTVAHVLNGRAEQLRISAATQARVHEAVQKLGYRPNAFARAVGSGRFNCAALIQPLQGVYLPTGLLLGIAEELQRHDMHLMVSETHSADLNADFLPKVVREVAADGLLINMLGAIEPHLLETLHSLNTPAVWINNKQPVDAVHPDDLHIGRWATEHLVQMGHKRIAFMGCGPLDSDGLHYSMHDRRSAYETVMCEAGLELQLISLPKTPEKLDDFFVDQRLPALLELLSSDSRPTGIVAYSDDVAILLLQAVAQLGLQLPRDLSLVTVADGPNHHIGRPVTAVCLSMGAVGKEAVRLLMRKIKNPSEPLPSIAVQPWFFGGDTTGPPP